MLEVLEIGVPKIHTPCINIFVIGESSGLNKNLHLLLKTLDPSPLAMNDAYASFN